MGWARGTKSVGTNWGAFFWTMQNHLDFKSSETNTQPYGSGWVMITNVMVKGLTNYPPMSDQTADWPDLGLAKSNYPGDNQGEEKTFQVDLTTYFQLAIPSIHVTPSEAAVEVGGSAVQFTAVGTNIDNGVAWSIDPSGGTNGATIQPSGNSASVTPGNVGQVYKIRAAVSNCPDFYDEAELSVVKLETETEATVPSDRARTKLGVGEKVTLTLEPSSLSPVTWSISGDGALNTTSGNPITFTAHERASSPSVTATYNGVPCTVNFTVVEPTGESAVKTSEDNYPAGMQGAGMNLKVTLHPTDVSFDWVEIREMPGPATGIYGYFTNYPSADLYHNPPSWLEVGPENDTTDYAWFADWPPPWYEGGYRRVFRTMTPV